MPNFSLLLALTVSRTCKRASTNRLRRSIVPLLAPLRTCQECLPAGRYGVVFLNLRRCLYFDSRNAAPRGKFAHASGIYGFIQRSKSKRRSPWAQASNLRSVVPGATYFHDQWRERASSYQAPVQLQSAFALDMSRAPFPGPCTTLCDFSLRLMTSDDGPALIL